MSTLSNSLKLIKFRKKHFLIFLFANLVFFVTPLGTSLLISEIFNQLQGIPTINIKVMNLAVILPFTYILQMLGLIFFVVFMVRFLVRIYTLLRKNLMEYILERHQYERLSCSFYSSCTCFLFSITSVLR